MASQIISNELPQDIVREILTRLTAKSLTRFKSLSRDYFNLIESSSFIADHLHQSAHRNSSLLINTIKGLYFLRYQCLEDLNSLVAFPKEGYKEFDGYLPIVGCSDEMFPMEGFREFDINNLRVVGCSNGLLCVVHTFSTSGSSMVSIWNPATRQVKPICWSYHVGFGFDSKEKDYKIVVISKDFIPCSNPSVKVFSLATGSWKVSQHDSLKSVFLKRFSVMANGALHWRGFFREPTTKILRNMIISFDLNKEVFKRIALPISDDNCIFNYDRMVLTVFDDPLALFLPGTINREPVFELWVLQNDDGGGECWTRIFTLAVGYQILNEREQPLAVWKNVIIYNSEYWPTDWECDHTKIFTVKSYNGQSFKVSVVHGSFITNNSTFLYEESLLPV